nr:ROK family protein [uncultured Cetobacterium sp.]
MKIVAIDIGGTAIKYGLVDGEGGVKDSSSLLTEASKGVDQLLEKIYFIVEKFQKIDGIAVSATGQIDGKIGKVVGGTDLIPGWIGTNLVDILERKYNVPAVLENDVNCAALGEMWKGAAREKDNFLCLTIGTGIGGGIVLNKELLRGEGSVAAEFGHIQIERDGDECGCGKKGCYQNYASTTALLKMAEKEFGRKINGKELFDYFYLDDKKAKKIIYRWVDYLTDGLATLIYIFNPTLIVIGGGVSSQGESLNRIISTFLEKKVMKNYLDILNIKMAERGNDAGMIGASYLLIEKIKRK